MFKDNIIYLIFKALCLLRLIENKSSMKQILYVTESVLKNNIYYGFFSQYASSLHETYNVNNVANFPP